MGGEGRIGRARGGRRVQSMDVCMDGDTGREREEVRRCGWEVRRMEEVGGGRMGGQEWGVWCVEICEMG